MSRDRSALCLYSVTGWDVMSRDRSALSLYSLAGGSPCPVSVVWYSSVTEL